MNEIKADLREYFPYKVVEASRAEGDDVIGFLARKYHIHEPIMIVSEDKDFRQLQQYPGVEQYAPVKHKMIKEKNPKEYIREHIIRGDSGDGVVNIFSDLDTFVNPDKRQKSVSNKKMPDWVKMSAEEFCADTGVAMKRWKFQQFMVDLSVIPQNVTEDIDGQYNDCIPADKSKVMEYLMKHKMRLLTDCLEEFIS